MESAIIKPILSKIIKRIRFYELLQLHKLLLKKFNFS